MFQPTNHQQLDTFFKNILLIRTYCIPAVTYYHLDIQEGLISVGWGLDGYRYIYIERESVEFNHSQIVGICSDVSIFVNTFFMN